MHVVPDWRGPFRPDAIPAELLTADRPYVVRGGFAHWPVVQAARRSDEDLARYLMGLYQGMRIGLFQISLVINQAPRSTIRCRKRLACLVFLNPAPQIRREAKIESII